MPTDTLKMLQTIRLRSIFTTRISCRKDKTLFSSFLVNHKNTCISLMTLMKTTNHYVVKFNMSFFCFPVFFFSFLLHRHPLILLSSIDSLRSPVTIYFYCLFFLFIFLSKYARRVKKYCFCFDIYQIQIFIFKVWLGPRSFHCKTT